MFVLIGLPSCQVGCGPQERGTVVWEEKPKPTTIWLESDIYTLEQGGKRYQTGLRSDGVVVWREIITVWDGIQRGVKK